jgi:Zn finger protein HypA/HybF involved in hydrogenase expression
VLDIEHVAMTGECADCGAAFGMAQPVFRCPVCQGIHVSLVSGRELLVNDVEVDDEVTEGVAS